MRSGTRQSSGPAWIVFAFSGMVLMAYAIFNVEVTMVSHMEVQKPPATTQATQPAVVKKTTPRQTRKTAPEWTSSSLDYNVDPKHNVHLVFTVSCDQGLRQMLSAALQLSLTRVGHRGPLTEVITGCSMDKIQNISKLPTLYADYRLHFVPDYAWQKLANGERKHYFAFNKPFGLQHFLDHAEPKDNLPVALIDVDYMLLKPLEVNRGSDWSRFYQVNEQTLRKPEDIKDELRDGIGIAQNMKAFLGGLWWNKHNSTIKDLVCKGLPCANVSNEEAMEYFEPAGTPYILTRSDMERVVKDYVAFTRKGRVYSDSWMVEMSAWGAAVANQNVKQTLVTHLGGATPAFQNTEYWDFLPENVDNPCTKDSKLVLPPDVPVGIHYAMYYGLGEDVKEGYAFYKYRIPRDIMNCDSMMLALPPASEWTKAKTKPERHRVWLQCTAIKYLNQVLDQVKRRTCPLGYNSFQGLILHAKMNYKNALPTKENLDFYNNMK